jgi:hypothetical protein
LQRHDLARLRRWHDQRFYASGKPHLALPRYIFGPQMPPHRVIQRQLFCHDTC